MPELMSEDAVRDLAQAPAETRSLHRNEVFPVHVLLCVAHHESDASSLLKAAGVEYSVLHAALTAGQPADKPTNKRELPWSSSMDHILQLSQSYTKKHFTSSHLLALILDNDKDSVTLLRECGLNVPEFRAALLSTFG
ncbi:ATP-dependent Clp protease ATP-binding subunit ClpA [Streptomyces umbrinus]|uniref:ATP-dependent Clp protease ATP-binding subunit ClpA n=1 Tax=Streptomyces umbrinus TaxID=67370 RepID=A0ABU0SXC7_9ACTN|nr:Clp protease N-terminal domain-containing protein [Streptomyces umbrinus]MDQ1028152.1 ATP-dependent Clp protease ATP-binding subunit ClpA [Streptomyces umbrinus]